MFNGPVTVLWPYPHARLIWGIFEVRIDPALQQRRMIHNGSGLCMDLNLNCPVSFQAQHMPPNIGMTLWHP